MREHRREHHAVGAASGLAASAGGYALKIAWIPSEDDLKGRLDFWIPDRDGRAVGNFDEQHLDPYLGALGHLVAPREGDLAYLHVHPMDGAGSRIAFHAAFPSAGRYRLFLQFAHEGRVLTAALTLEGPS